jgi:hypothetical protein
MRMLLPSAGRRGLLSGNDSRQSWQVFEPGIVFFGKPSAGFRGEIGEGCVYVGIGQLGKTDAGHYSRKDARRAAVRCLCASDLTQ